MEEIIALVEEKKGTLSPVILGLMPDGLTDDQQLEWLVKAENVTPPETVPTNTEKVTRIGNYTQAQASLEASIPKKPLTVAEQINQNFADVKNGY